MMIFSYKIEHDLGLAPNPFGGFCTLAICKPQIRRSKRLSIGDWVVGTGSAKLNRLGKLIYAMQVEEKLSFQEYWDDPRFAIKRPIINGSLAQMYGDNIYHQDKVTGEWIQEDSAHSNDKGTVNKDHLETDLSGQFVLISRNFYYFGDAAVPVPEAFEEMCSQGRNLKSTGIPVSIRGLFIEWLESKYRVGIHGDPINWRHHQPSQGRLNFR